MVLGVPIFKHFRVIDDITSTWPEQTVNLYVCSEHAVGSLNILRCMMSTSPSFSAMFSKGDNLRDFLFAYLEDKLFPKWGLLLKE